MPTLELARSVTLHYEDDDFSDPWKDSPTVLLHHGFGRSSRFWYSWIPILAGHCRVIRIDARGFGQSTLPSGFEGTFRVDEFIGDIIDMLDRLDIGQVHFGGESFGGIVGGVLAAEHPERVRTLTIVSSPTRVHEQGQRISALGRASYLAALQELGPEGWARESNSFRFPADVDPGLPAWYAEEMGKTDAKSLHALVKLFPEVDLAPYLPRIQAPTLLLYPDQGKYADEREIFEQHVKNLRVVVIEARYHTIATVHPERCASEMLDFILSGDG